MRIDRLDLENFRNMESLSVLPCESVNIIYGDNAQGKTNLLEAVWLLSGAKSFRGAKDADLVRFGESHTLIDDNTIIYVFLILYYDMYSIINIVIYWSVFLYMKLVLNSITIKDLEIKKIY